MGIAFLKKIFQFLVEVHKASWIYVFVIDQLKFTKEIYSEHNAEIKTR